MLQQCIDKGGGFSPHEPVPFCTLTNSGVTYRQVSKQSEPHRILPRARYSSIYAHYNTSVHHAIPLAEWEQVSQGPQKKAPKIY